ncbi:Tda4p SCDLUD_000059 [Saccharomycodes ludwigii]|uniref:Tda4p n=1 Tax=Saccharomycodes ludwigii TaxID=36035 RepID=UPI001E841348|nr:hypothetical protein SCDLUD_000059 [Saccharomycodes ludwigii]KAH3902482.1 hypothetical protein SCDLUD_000059 [Saccharomycodes ludwigii]
MNNITTSAVYQTPLSDPFLKFSPFKNLTDSLYLIHLHEIVGSFIFYQFILYQWLAPNFNKFFFRKAYTKIEDKKLKVNFDIHVVSMVQCLISIYLVLPPAITQPFGLNINSYTDSYNSMVSSVSVGYFLWDLCVCVQHFNLFGLQFLCHCLASLFVFFSTLRPFCQSWVCKFLIFEASTPFVNINWFISVLVKQNGNIKIPTWFNVLNGISLILVFFLVRIVWGFTAISVLAYQAYKIWDEVPHGLMSIILMINFLLDFLNIFWLSKMLKIAKKMLGGNETTARKGKKN